MKQVYRYQEIRPLIEQGKEVTVTCHLHAEVTVMQKRPASDTITATLHLLVGEDVIAVVQSEYPSFVSLLDAFDIDETCEQWEVREPQRQTARPEDRSGIGRTNALNP
jgi:hypothetical protein